MLWRYSAGGWCELFCRVLMICFILWWVLNNECSKVTHNPHWVSCLKNSSAKSDECPQVILWGNVGMSHRIRWQKLVGEAEAEGDLKHAIVKNCQRSHAKKQYKHCTSNEKLSHTPLSAHSQHPPRQCTPHRSTRMLLAAPYSLLRYWPHTPAFRTIHAGYQSFVPRTWMWIWSNYKTYIPERSNAVGSIWWSVSKKFLSGIDSLNSRSTPFDLWRGVNRNKAMAGMWANIQEFTTQLRTPQ